MIVYGACDLARQSKLYIKKKLYTKFQHLPRKWSSLISIYYMEREEQWIVLAFVHAYFLSADLSSS
jgi:hypothetical protein